MRTIAIAMTGELIVCIAIIIFAAILINLSPDLMELMP